MTLAIETEEKTGIPFIDSQHPMIAEAVKRICEDLACRKPLESILDQIDTLAHEIQPYLLDKSNCQNQNACKIDIYVQDTLARLIDLRNTLANFGDSMPPSVAIMETQQWAKLHIFDDDHKCENCPKLLPPQ